MSCPSGTLADAVADWLTARCNLEIAKAVRRLLTESGAKAAGWCHRKDKKTVEVDPELTAFFRSVARSGTWDEERDRVRTKRKREKRMPEDVGLPGAHPMPLPAIIRCLPIWRSWGRLLIEAERAKPSSPVAPAGTSSNRSSGDSGKSGANDLSTEEGKGGPGMKGP